MAGITAAVSVKLQPFLKSKKSQRFTVFVAKSEVVSSWLTACHRTLASIGE